MCEPHSLKDFIGIPFVDEGRDFESCDCWGLVSLAYKHLYDAIIPDYKISCFKTEEIRDQIEGVEACTWQKVDIPGSPCLIIMAIDPDLPGYCNHLGLYVGDHKFLHTMRKKNSVLEKLNHPYFGRKIKGFLKYVG